MFVTDQGHAYHLKVLDGTPGADYLLRFVKKGSYAGTTSGEVLRALIDRAEYADSRKHDWRIFLGVVFMEWTVWLLEWSAAKLHGRKRPTIFQAVFGETCAKCGHVGCKGECYR